MKKLPRKSAKLLNPLFISGFMTLVVSGVSSAFSLGLIDGFFNIWMGAWGLSWLIAFPTLLVFMPLIQKMVNRLLEPL